jgi:L,D-peptidoglycan transpeptidase YkuD (ErfK/YbiS/YcfS/YnhG family)
LEIDVSADGSMAWPGHRCRCALGRGGVKPVAEKREGDGTTPAGTFPIRRLLYRADRSGALATVVPAIPLTREDGWCDAPTDPAYNRPVKLPYPASAESLWRRDHVYDIIVVIGHNDDPVVPGRGSAIFLHLSRTDYAPTDGCIAISRGDMARLLGGLTLHSRLIVRA